MALEAMSARMAAPAKAAPCRRPLFAVAAVLLGAFISTLNTRVTTFGLADIRGGLGLGFDEGSWVTTMFSASQMIVAGPMVVLYILSIAIAWIFGKKKPALADS